MTHYYNKLQHGVRFTPRVDEDFNIFRIIKNDASTPLDLFAYLQHVEQRVLSVKYSGAFVYLLAVKTSKVSCQTLRQMLPSVSIKTIEQLNSRIVEPIVLLNLLLNYYAADKFACSGPEINGKFIQIVKSNKNEAIGIHCQFNGADRDIYLEAHVNTFTKYKLLNEKIQQKCSSFFVLKNNTMLRKPADVDVNESFVFRQRFKDKKNTWGSFALKTPSGNSKIDIIGDIYNYFKYCPYVLDFEFCSVEMEQYDRHQYFERTKTQYRDFYQTHELNVICPDDFDRSAFSSKDFSFLSKVNFVDVPQSGVNLVLLRFTKEGNQESDTQYRNDLMGNYVCQHINVDRLSDATLSSEIITALRELIIKYEIKELLIESFDWSHYDNFETNTLTFCKKVILESDDEDEDVPDDEIFYYITVNLHNGQIKIDKSEYPEFLGEAIYHMDSSDIGTIVADDGQSLTLKKSDYHIVPYYRDYIEEIKMYLDGKQASIDGGDAYDLMSEIAEQRDDIRPYISELLNSDELKNIVFKNSGSEIRASELKKIIQSVSEKGKTINSELDTRLRDNYDFAIVSRIKSKKDEIFPALVGLHYSDNIFTVAENENSINDQPKNIIINRIHYHNQTKPEFFKLVLPMFYVSYIRNNMLAAKPFPFKYLDEYIKRDIFCMKKVESH